MSFQPNRLYTGQISRLFSDRGFAFLTTKINGRDTSVFVHVTNLIPGLSFDALKVGDKVTYLFGGFRNDDSTKPFAVQVAKATVEGGPKERIGTLSRKPSERAQAPSLKPLASPEVAVSALSPAPFQSPVIPPDEPSLTWEEILEWLLAHKVASKDIARIEKRINNPKTSAQTFTFIERLIMGDKVSNASQLSFASKFTKFCELNPQWNFPNNIPNEKVLFFRSYEYVWPREILKEEGQGGAEKLHAGAVPADTIGDWLTEPGFLVIRRQTRNNCYLNAPVTLLHYILLINTRGRECSMVDISLFEAKKYSNGNGGTLANLILTFGGEGGDSISFLRYELLRSEEEKRTNKINFDDLSTHDCVKFTQEDWDFCMETLQHRPALVSNFHMTKEFFEQNSVVNYIDPPSTEDFQWMNNRVVSHAMVCIGCRKVDTQHYFLCQNTVKRKHLVEISAVYLQACRAQFTFVWKHVTTVPSDLNTSLGIGGYFESSCIEEEKGTIEGP